MTGSFSFFSFLATCPLRGICCSFPHSLCSGVNDCVHHFFFLVTLTNSREKQLSWRMLFGLTGFRGFMVYGWLALLCIGHGEAEDQGVRLEEQSYPHHGS